MLQSIIRKDGEQVGRDILGEVFGPPKHNIFGPMRKSKTSDEKDSKKPKDRDILGIGSVNDVLFGKRRDEEPVSAEDTQDDSDEEDLEDEDDK